MPIRIINPNCTHGKKTVPCTEIIKELALKLDPTYKEIQIDGSIEY